MAGLGSEFVSEFYQGARVWVPLAAVLLTLLTFMAGDLSFFYPEVSLSRALSIALLGDAVSGLLGNVMTLFIALWTAVEA